MFSALLLACLCSSCSYSQKKPVAVTQKAGSGFAVVELFTSEGCSSCPPADALLGKLKTQFGDQLFVLSFHVDYWNRLGWKDPFSSAEYTARQNRYAAAFRSENVYTPQAVVNGKAHVTGSNRSGLERLIGAELNMPAPRSIRLSATSDGKGGISVSYDATLQAGEVLNLALVQLRTSTAVRAGENGGRKLEHVSVVRDFKTVRDGKGMTRLVVPEGLPVSAFAVIGYMQREGRMEVIGANEVAIQ